MFYKSKKFAYAVTMLLAALFLALAPAALNLNTEQTQNLTEMIPWVLGFGYALIAGHSVMDALSMAKGVQVPTVNDAIQNVVEAIENP